MSTARRLTADDLPAVALQRVLSARAAVVACRLRVGFAERRVNGNPTPSAFAEYDRAVAGANAADAEEIAAWLAYGAACGIQVRWSCGHCTSPDGS